MAQDTQSDEYFICSCCNNQVVPHTTTSWRTDDGTIVSVSQYTDIAAVIGSEEDKRVICVNCYCQRRFGGLQIEPSSIHFQAGRNYQIQGRLDEALTAYGEALAAEKDAEVYAAIGDCLTLAGHIRQAEEAFSTGLSLDRHHRLCLSGGIELFLDTRQIEPARQWLAIAEEASAERAIPQPRRLLYRARLCLLLQNREEAEQCYSAGMQLLTDAKEREEFKQQWVKVLGEISSS